VSLSHEIILAFLIYFTLEEEAIMQQNSQSFKPKPGKALFDNPASW